MTKKRYIAVAGLLAILLGAGFGVAMMLSDGPGVTKASFDRIEKGMTLAEVEFIFGGPTPLRENWSRVRWPLTTDPDAYWAIDAVHCWDAGDGSGATIGFKDGQVVFVDWAASSETVLEKFRRWLRL